MNRFARGHMRLFQSRPYRGDYVQCSPQCLWQLRGMAAGNVNFAFSWHVAETDVPEGVCDLEPWVMICRRLSVRLNA